MAMPIPIAEYFPAKPRINTNVILTTLIIAVPLTFILGFSFGVFTANKTLANIHEVRCGQHQTK